MSLAKGIYFITNAANPLDVDLDNGSSNNGASVIGTTEHPPDSAYSYNQLWLLVPVKDKDDVYTLRNLRGGTYMSLESGSSSDGTRIQGFQYTGTDQEWIIRPVGEGTYSKMQNVTSGTFANLHNGGNSDGTPIDGLRGSWDVSNTHQLWSFRCISLTNTQILGIFKTTSMISNDRVISYLGVDAIYLPLPEETLKSIWQGSVASTKSWRPQLFDYDGFAIAYKSAVARWGAANFRADDFAIICGVIVGVAPHPDDPEVYQVHAWNWMAHDTYFLPKVKFFEPQRGDFSVSVCFDFLITLYTISHTKTQDNLDVYEASICFF